MLRHFGLGFLSVSLLGMTVAHAAEPGKVRSMIEANLPGRTERTLSIEEQVNLTPVKQRSMDASESDLPFNQNKPGDNPPKIYALAPAGAGKPTITLYIESNGEPLLRKRGWGEGIGFYTVTPKEAKELWGGRGSSEHRTFFVAGSNGQKLNRFKIELRFKDGHCSDYKVSGPSITDTDWKSSELIAMRDGGKWNGSNR